VRVGMEATSLLTRFRPPTWLTLETHVQYKRNPARCQFRTVLGVTKMSGLVHPDQHVLNATQNSLCRAVNRRRGCCACRASNCRRRARFSRTRSSIIAGIISEKSESSFAPSHSFCRCTTFWRGTPEPQAAGTALLSFVLYNYAAYDHIRKNHLYRVPQLENLLQSGALDSKIPNNRTIPPFPVEGISLKTVWWPVAKDKSNADADLGSGA
jgi:hypothetical protein